MIDSNLMAMVASLDMDDMDRAVMMADLVALTSEVDNPLTEPTITADDACYVYETSTVLLRKRRKIDPKTFTFSKETKDARLKEERGICQWCHLPIVEEWHAHHIIPKSKGGTCDPKNLMVLHPECHINPIAFSVLHDGMEMPKAFNRSGWVVNDR